MGKIVSASVVAIGFLGGVQIASAEGDFLELSSLAREVVAASPGVETIIPYFIERDTTADGYPDRLYFRFRVYAGGTTTLLHSSVSKSEVVAAPPCDTPQTKDFDFPPKFLGEIGSTRAHVAISMSMGCSEQGTGDWKESFRTFVYSADLSSAAGTVWTYTLTREVLSFDLVDVTGDGINEIMLTTTYPVDPLNDAAGENITVRTMNATTGALVSEKGYAVVRP
jgi:hypothetical protein